MRQIGLSQNLYCMENKERFEDFRQSGGSGVKVWRAYLQRYVNGGSDWQDDAIGKTAVWHCPESPDYKGSSEWANLAQYGGNECLNGFTTSTKRYRFLSNVGLPSKTMLSIDASTTNGWHTINEYSSTSSVLNWIKWRHNETAQMVFIDGHIENNRYTTDSISEIKYFLQPQLPLDD
jgi:prepilin-type processing-associated H-X9-DG protein